MARNTLLEIFKFSIYLTVPIGFMWVFTQPGIAERVIEWKPYVKYDKIDPKAEILKEFDEIQRRKRER